MGIEIVLTAMVITASAVAGIYGLLEKYDLRNSDRFREIQTLATENRNILVQLFSKVQLLELVNDGEHKKLNRIMRDLSFSDICKRPFADSNEEENQEE